MPAFIFGKIQRTNGNYKQCSATRYSTQAPLFRLWDRVAKISTPGKCVSGDIRKEALSLRVIMSYANQNAILSTSTNQIAGLALAIYWAVWPYHFNFSFGFVSDRIDDGPLSSIDETAWWYSIDDIFGLHVAVPFPRRKNGRVRVQGGLELFGELKVYELGFAFHTLC